MIKTFRGLLADGGQDRIKLSTIKGKVGYQIVKLQIIGIQPSAINSESTVKIYKDSQSSITDTIDLSEGALLAVAYRETNAAGTSNEPEVIIFDREIFNQDIYITHENTEPGRSCNYYLELEVIPLTDQGAEYSTLRDIRTAVTSTI